MENEEASAIAPLIEFKPAMAGMTFKVGAKVVQHGQRWQVREASALPLVRRYEAVFG